MIKIGIVTGSIRDMRVNLDVAKWVLEIAQNYDVDAEFEIVDIKEYDLPMINMESPSVLNKDYPDERIQRWSEKIDSLDGYIFITPEYNKASSPALANAIDSLSSEWANKACGYVSYGSKLGVPAVMVLRMKMINFMTANVQAYGTLSLEDDFIDEREFNPSDKHIETIQLVIDQTISWSEALKNVRTKNQLDEIN